jgi:hemoglobin
VDRTAHVEIGPVTQRWGLRVPLVVVACDGGSVETTLYDAVGDATLLALARAWHARCMADAVVAHAFHGGVRPDHTERLAAYWAEALGGPAAYSDTYGGESQVLRIHAGNGEHLEMDQRALDCFVAALDDVGVSGHAVRDELTDWFRVSIERMAGYPGSPDDVPDGLTIGVWRREER